MHTHTHRLTDGPGQRSKSRGGEEASETRGDEGIGEEKSSEERRRGWMEAGGHGC